MHYYVRDVVDVDLMIKLPVISTTAAIDKTPRERKTFGVDTMITFEDN